MESREPGRPEPDWPASVHVREEPDLAAEIQARLTSAERRRSVSVTDLLALRQAFWKAVAPPVPVPEERKARMDVGRFLHRELGALLARDGQLEVRVRREGLVGRIDALTDRPVEVKTAGQGVEAESLVRDRPEYIEQLGMYCALLDRSNGRLLTLGVREGRVESVRSAEVAYRRPGVILEEMHRRAERLRTSWAAKRADGLPRCPWFDLGCQFRAGPTCDCTGGEGSEPSPILAEVESVVSSPEFAGRIGAVLEERLTTAEPPTIARFRDMVYPRRAYFEHVGGAAPAGTAPPPGFPPSDDYGRLVEAVESGPVGEVARLPEFSREPAEEVAAFRGDPYLVRTSRARRPPLASELLSRFPQYALELGFRCASTGRRTGRVVVGYERPERNTDALRVFRLEFDPVTPLARLWRERERAFRAALEAKAPEPLAACPAWMFDGCPYRAECGCGSATPRSQR